MPITAILEKNASWYENDVALVEINPEQRGVKKGTWREYDLIEASNRPYYRKEITWGVFNEKANRFAHALISHGIGKGKKVAILMMNCLEWLPIYFGILKTGAVAVPLNFRYAAEEIRYCVNLADVDVMVFGPEFIGRLEEIVDDMGRDVHLIYCGEPPCPTFAYDYNALVADYSSVNPEIEIDEDDEAAIYFSSGTTGFPKAILHLHRALSQSCVVEQKHHGQRRDDVFLCIPPLYHTGAKMHWFGSFLVGAKSVLLKGTKPEYILDAVSKEQCTIVWLLVPWAQDDTNYGLSESIGPGCVHLGIENIHKVGAIGKAGYGWQTKITAEDGSEITEPNVVGELCVKGPGVMVCYYNNPEATDEVLKGDWLHTGDMAIYDEDGFIFLVDRKKDVIISGGENLYPVQIEDFLRRCDKIKDVAVIGMPHPRLGEIAAAIIELKEGVECTEQEINDFCAELPRYKRPRKIIFEHVPRNATGKIEKPALREKYCGGRLVEEQTKAWDAGAKISISVRL